MAQFAQLDDNNFVIQVIVISDSDTADNNGVESEEIGISFCKKLLGANTRWKQSFSNGSKRVRPASFGYTYDENLDAFIRPTPFPSWVLNNNTADWESPLGPEPELTEDQISSKLIYVWDEDAYQADNTTGWVLEMPPQPPQ